MEDCFFGRKISLKSQTEFDSLVFKSKTKWTMKVKYYGCDRLGNLTARFGISEEFHTWKVREQKSSLNVFY